jgi:chromosome segregation ATPase
MEFLEGILSTEVIAGILIIASFGMCIRSILHFTREAAVLQPKLGDIERELVKWREGMADKKAAVEKLNKEVAPLREAEAKMRLYYESMKEMELNHEKKKMKEQEKEQSDRQRRIQRKKMGFGE